MSFYLNGKIISKINVFTENTRFMSKYVTLEVDDLYKDGNCQYFYTFFSHIIF